MFKLDTLFSWDVPDEGTDDEARVIESILTALPYVLVLAILVSTLWVKPEWESEREIMIWSLARWVVRIIVWGATGLLWWQTRDRPRPLWLYGWLGFAIYEMVAAAISLVAWFTTNVWVTSDGIGILGVLLLPLLFLPYVVAGTAVAWRNRLLAAYMVFPHAALTVPLFVTADRAILSSGLPQGTIVAFAVPVALAGAIAAIFAWLRPSHRWRLLIVGVIACQLLLAVGFWLADSFPLILAPILIGLGLAILGGPILGQQLLEWALALISAIGGDAWLDRLRERMQPGTYGELNQVLSLQSEPLASNGEASMSEQTQGPSQPQPQNPPQTRGSARPPLPPGREGNSSLDRMYRWSVVLLTALIVIGIVIFVGRAAVYKIHEYERGLHLRGGRFIAVQEPGWHIQVPLVDTVIIVKVNERLGYVDQIEAMTSDNVAMNVSLQYTYRVTNPEQFALQVDDPERIVFEFVQGRLRDVVNTKAMTAVMNDRALMNQEVMAALTEKETQYGVQFITVQLQSASPPSEVLAAIKDRMVAVQRQDQAQAEAAQRQTLADADLYAAQKQAEAEAYQISATAQAEADRIRLTTEVQQLAVRAILAELSDKGVIGEKYIEYLIAQELKENSKWIISGDGTPIVDLRAGE